MLGYGDDIGFPCTQLGILTDRDFLKPNHHFISLNRLVDEIYTVEDMEISILCDLDPIKVKCTHYRFPPIPQYCREQVIKEMNTRLLFCIQNARLLQFTLYIKI